MPLSGSAAARPGELTGVLRLLVYLVIAAILMVLDVRGGWLHVARRGAETLMQPLWWLVAQPGRLTHAIDDALQTHRQLLAENARLRQALLVSHARNARLSVLAAENDRLRGLLDSASRARLDAQLANVLDVDLDPTRQRLLLGAGSRQGVRVGQAVIDATGLVGQVISTTPTTATVLLITDPDHAVPVMVARSGVRLVVYGIGRSDLLHLGDIPLSADVRAGDELLTSGLGQRFPPGFAVGRIQRLYPDESRTFLEADVIPAAQLDRGRDVLLLRGPALASSSSPAPAAHGSPRPIPASPRPAEAAR